MRRANSLRSFAGRFALIILFAMIVAVAVFSWHRRTIADQVVTPPTAEQERIDPAVRQAIGSARAAVQQDPQSAAAWGKLGMVFLAHELPAQANISFAQAERLDSREPRWPYYQAVSLTSGQPEAAIPKLRRAAQLCGQDCIPCLLRLAELLLQHGAWDEAETHFRQVLRQEPNNPVAALGLARVYRAQGKQEEAVAQAGRAAGDVHTAKASQLFLAQVYARIGKQAEAIAARREAARLHEDVPWPDAFAEEVTRLSTGKQARISQADQFLGQNRPHEAITVLQDVVRDYPDADWAWLLLGRAFLTARDLSAAERALRRAAQLAPGSLLVHYHLGIVALVKKDYSEAAASFRKALQLQPDFALAHGDLGTCLFLQGDRAGAEEAFRMALRCKPDYAQAHAGLGELLSAQQRNVEAIGHLKQAVELNPSDAHAAKLLERIQARSGNSGVPQN